MRFRLGVLSAVLAGPVSAGCVSFDTFTQGVTVKQADGSIWTVRRGAHDVIRMDRTNPEGVYAKYEVAAYGVYELEGTRNGIGPTTENTFAKAPPQPFAGMDWTSNFKTNSIPHYDKSRQDWYSGKVRVTADDLREVKISGCKYKVMGVDVARHVNDRTTVVHYLYFPDLRFGTQTRITYQDGTKAETGVTSLTALN